MSAISGTARAKKQLVDGTWALTVHVDPIHGEAFLRMLGAGIDQPVAIALLVNDFEQKAPGDEADPEPRKARETYNAPERPQGGALAKLAGRWCARPDFREFLFEHHMVAIANPREAAEFVRSMCKVASRAELDNNRGAAETFNAEFRIPFMSWLGEQDDA